MGLFFGQPACSVLERSEDRGGEVVEAYLHLMGLKLSVPHFVRQSTAQVLTHLYSSARQLWEALHYVSEGIDVGNVRLFDLSISTLANFFVVLNFDSDLTEVQQVSSGVSADRHQHSIVAIRCSLLCFLIFDHCMNLIALLFETDWQRCGYDIYVPLFKVIENGFHHISVEGSKVLAPCHQSSVKSKPSQKACNLHCDVPTPDHKGLSGCLFEGENIVTRDGQVRPLDVEVRGSGASCDHKVFGFDFLIQNLLFFILRQFALFDEILDDLPTATAHNGIFVFESGEAIQILQFLLIYLRDVAKVQRLDMILNSRTQPFPLKRLQHI